MQINPIKLTNKNKFNIDYRNEDETVINFFDYSPFTDDNKRLKDIKNRSFNRDQLVDILTQMNQVWDAPEATIKQIERLAEDDSVVVIGGQQAGLATGPLYTVNKIISIIQLARQKEQALNVPVIPVFWIAGEDHDYDEINHTFIHEDDAMKKLATSQQVLLKQSISTIKISHDETGEWLKRLFLSLQETEQTKELYESLRRILNESETIVDFFARTIFHLFQEEGLVLFDSAHPLARNMESDFFVELINKQQPFAQAVHTQVEKLRQDGHTVTIDAELDDTHLFYHDEQNERILLKRENDYWTGKNDEVQLTTDELLNLAKVNPERLSNNVVSRPLMQEYLFPTLAFVAGDGEISYWAALKEAFHLFGFNMPPVTPRLSFTYVNRTTKAMLDERMISAESAINNGVKDTKINWLQSQHQPPVSVVTEQVKMEIEKIHLPLRKAAQSISEDVYQVAERNLEIINREIDYVQKRMDYELKRQHQSEIDKYNYIENMLFPNNGLQERVWNPIPFINENGYNFINSLAQKDCQFENDHYIIYL